MTASNRADLGANAWIVDEMYRDYLDNPESVSESWREFFVGYRPGSGHASTPIVNTAAHAVQEAAAQAAPTLVPPPPPAERPPLSSSPPFILAKGLLRERTRGDMSFDGFGRSCFQEREHKSDRWDEMR